MNIHPSPTHNVCVYFTRAMLCLGCNIQVLAAETQAVNRQAIAVTSEISLLQAEQRFVLYNRSVLAARRDVEAAEADRLIAGQRPNPQLSIGFSSVNLNRGQGNLNQNGSTAWIDKTYNSSVQINQLIERGGKQALRTAVADGGLLASKLDLRETLRQQRLSMLAAYYDLKLAQDIQGLLTEQQSLSQHILQAAELRLRAGDIAPAEVMRLRVDVLSIAVLSVGLLSVGLLRAKNALRHGRNGQISLSRRESETGRLFAKLRYGRGYWFSTFSGTGSMCRRHVCLQTNYRYQRGRHHMTATAHAEAKSTQQLHRPYKIIGAMAMLSMPVRRDDIDASAADTAESPLPYTRSPRLDLFDRWLSGSVLRPAHRIFLAAMAALRFFGN